jgi:hypothetical protein
MAMAVAVQTMAEVLSDRRADWVRQYRDGHPSADLWGRGLRHVSHSTETQERVFRMAEQLVRRGVDRTDLFMALEEADRSVALSGDLRDAAQAGCSAISPVIHLKPESVVICAGENPSILRALGFDPLYFDGHDPSAYAWVMFELSLRAEADRRSQWRRCVPQGLATPAPIGLACL